VSVSGINSDLAGKAAGGRRLIAVVRADMAGYSRLIGLDDVGTLRRLRTLRRALIDPAIREYGGKVVQTGGVSEATHLQPTITVRSYYPFYPMTPSAVAQFSRMLDGMRLAGVRDHADEDADAGLPPDSVLHTNYSALTPTTAPGARTIRTLDLAEMNEHRKPLVLDTVYWGRSIPGAIGLLGAGIGGSTSDEYQGRLAKKMLQLTGDDRTVPIVTIGFNSERYQGRNLALRLVALGYTDVYWYRGGREAWEVAGLPETEVAKQDW
jgi:rhodanese-related sulfurtransferase